MASKFLSASSCGNHILSNWCSEISDQGKVGYHTHKTVPVVVCREVGLFQSFEDSRVPNMKMLLISFGPEQNFFQAPIDIHMYGLMNAHQAVVLWARLYIDVAVIQSVVRLLSTPFS